MTSDPSSGENDRPKISTANVWKVTSLNTSEGLLLTDCVKGVIFM